MAGGGEPSKLYLVMEADASAAERLAAVLSVVTPSSVLLRPAPGAALEAQAVLPLLQAAQQRGVAVLLQDDAALARTVKADGVHLTWSKDIAARAEEARDILGHRFMVGADVGRSRHDAMEMGEAGVDYVAFGIPPHVEDRDTAIARRYELCAWWGEIFEVPCVAFDVETIDEAERLVAARADFVALALPRGMTLADTVAFAREADARIAAVEVSA